MVLGGAQTVDAELRGNSSAFVSLSPPLPLSLFLFFLPLLCYFSFSLTIINCFSRLDSSLCRGGSYEEESTNSDRNDRTEVTDLGLFFHPRFSFLLFSPPSLFLLWFEETAVTTRFDEFALRLVITS